MALKMFYSLNLQTNRTLSNGIVGLRGYQKNKAYFRAEGVRMDRTEICDVARRTIDNVLGAGNSSYTNTFKVN